MVGRAIRLGIVALMVFALTGIGTSAGVIAAKNDDCAGLDAYMAELVGFRAQLQTLMDDLGNDDLSTWSPEQFTAISEAIAGVVKSLDAMEVPPVAVEFHQALIAQLELSSQMFATMATAGIFGALIFAQQMDKLTATTDAASEKIATTCNVDFAGELGLDDSENGDTPGAGADSGTVDANGPGTRDQPIPLGESATVTPDWELTVLSVEPDATDAVMNESSFNDAPAAGQQFFIATVQVTYTGSSSETFNSASINTVGQSSVAYDWFDNDCGSVPNALPDREVFAGGSIEGNLCWSVDAADAGSLVLYDSNLAPEDRVFFSLVPGTAEATPAAGESGTQTSGGFPDAIASAVAQLGGAPAPPARELTLTDTGFQPAVVMLNTASLPAVIAIANTGTATHTFTIVELDIEITVEPGATAQVTIPAGTPPGNYSFESTPNGSTEDGLVGMLIVR